MLKCILQFTLIFCFGSSAAAGGYESVPWGVAVENVAKKFSKGQKLKLGQGYIYRQMKPDHRLARRTFGFDESGLHTVTIVFDEKYVKSKKLENIVAEQIHSYGEAIVDRTEAPYKLSYRWDRGDAIITLGYAPQRYDMVVMVFERK